MQSATTQIYSYLTTLSLRYALTIAAPGVCGRVRPWSADSVFAQLLAQGGAMDAQHRGRAALVALAVVEDFGEQRDLEFAQCDLVQVVGIATRSEEHTSELQSLMRNSYADLCMKNKTP